jgi:predicted RNA-binding Zn-ribbon protein involved in translation (DUF1610 family)
VPCLLGGRLEEILFQEKSGAIQPFIESFTEPGDLVVDFFAGSGMTGLAALTLNRRARLSDISVLGCHIANGYLQEAPARKLLDAAADVAKKARNAVGSLYRTKRESDGATVDVVRTIWSFTYRCPACHDTMVYMEHLDRNGRPPATCPSCGGPFARRTWPRDKDVPMEVAVVGEDRKQLSQAVSAHDRQHIRDAENDSCVKEIPSQTIDEHREMYSRSGLGKAGMTETRSFFSARNGITLLVSYGMPSMKSEVKPYARNYGSLSPRSFRGLPNDISGAQYDR